MGDSVIGRLVYKIVGDDRDFQKSLKRSAKALKKSGRQMQQLGKSLTLGLTLPIAGIGAAMVKTAIDAEETRAKFETAFAGITTAADETVSGLQEGYGLARQEAESLLSDTGDLLKGFGATSDQALTLSDDVQKLAVDLSSYNNLQGGATRASEILTKAMLGERDALTSLGIKVSETDVKQQLLENGQGDLTGRAKLLARAQATLELAYTQSGDALGDYNRTQDSTANQLRQLKADIKDLSVSIGRELLPTVRAGLQTVGEWVDKFQDLSDNNKEFIISLLKVAGLLAASGPIIMGIGAVKTAIGSLIFMLSATNPVGLIAVATAAGVALAITADEGDRARASTAAVSESFSDLRRMAEEARWQTEAVGRSTEEIVEQAGIMGRRYEAMAEAAKKTKEEQQDITQELEDQQEINQQYQDYWDKVNDRWKTLGENLAVYTDNLEAIKDLEDPERKREELELLERQLQLDIGMLEQEEKFPVTAEARLKLLNQIQTRLRWIAYETGEAGRLEQELEFYVKGTGDAAQEAGDNIGDAADETKRWDDYLKHLKKDAKDTGDVMVTAADASLDAWGATFEALGEGMVNWENGIEGLKEAFKGVFVSILKAFGEQYAVQAVAALIPGLTFNPAAAAGYAAVSAGAYAAAGMISSFGSGGSFYADEPQIIMVGDRPEHVNIEPVDHVAPPGGMASGGGTYNFYGDLYGYDDFAEKIEMATDRAARIGRVSK